MRATIVRRVAAAAIVAAMTAAMVPGGAAAADLVNRDDTAHVLRLHDGPTTIHTSIEGNTTRISVCSSCVIEVEGIGEIEVLPGTARVVIEDGVLRVE